MSGFTGSRLAYFDSGGTLAAEVYVDGIMRQILTVSRDRHHLKDGLVGYDIQLRLTGTAKVQAVECEFAEISNG